MDKSRRKSVRANNKRMYDGAIIDYNDERSAQGGSEQPAIPLSSDAEFERKLDDVPRKVKEFSLDFWDRVFVKKQGRFGMLDRTQVQGNPRVGRGKTNRRRFDADLLDYEDEVKDKNDRKDEMEFADDNKSRNRAFEEIFESMHERVDSMISSEFDNDRKTDKLRQKAYGILYPDMLEPVELDVSKESRLKTLMQLKRQLEMRMKRDLQKLPRLKEMQMVHQKIIRLGSQCATKSDAFNTEEIYQEFYIADASKDSKRKRELIATIERPIEIFKGAIDAYKRHYSEEERETYRDYRTCEILLKKVLREIRIERGDTDIEMSVLD
jgi:hypothetical protein